MKKRTTAGAALMSACVLCVVFLNCGENEKAVKGKLEIILRDDLEALCNDVPQSSLRDSVYYVIDEFQFYAKSKFSYRAVVDFYFLKEVMVSVERKYRYRAALGMWERYTNEYKFFRDSLHAP